MKTKFILILLIPVFALAQNNGFFYNSAYLDNSAYLTFNGNLYFDGGSLKNDGDIIFMKNITNQTQQTFNFEGNGDFIMIQENYIEGKFAIPNLVITGTSYVNDTVFATNLILNGILNLLSNGYLSANNFIFADNSKIRTLDNSILELSINPGNYTIPFYTEEYYSGIVFNSNDFAKVKFSVRGNKYEQIEAENYLNKYWILNFIEGQNFANAKFYYEDDELVGDEASLIPLLFLESGSLEGVSVNTDDNYLDFNDASSGIYTAASQQASLVYEFDYQLFAVNNIIKYRFPQTSDLIIYDILGQKITEVKNTKNGFIQIKNSGIYIVRIINDKKQFSTKVFIGN